METKAWAPALAWLAAATSSIAPAAAQTLEPGSDRPTVTVLGTRSEGGATSPWGTAVPASTLAQSITSVSGDELAALGATRVEDLAGLVPGFQADVSSAGLSSAVRLRGFLSTRMYLNGQPDVQRLFARDLATVERVDVLSGPAGLFFGMASPGGVVHYTGKQPRFEASSALRLGVDQFGVADVMLDATGPLKPDLAYRAVLSLRDGDTPPASLPQRRSTLLGALTWSPSPADRLTFEAEAMVNRTPYVFGTVITGQGPGAQPQYDRLYVVPGGGPTTRTMQRWAVDGRHVLAPDWAVSARVSAARGSRDEALFGFWTVESDTELSGYFTEYHDTWSQSAVNVRVDGAFTAAGMRHQAAFGAEYLGQRFLFSGVQNIAGFVLDVANPDFRGVDPYALVLSPRLLHEHSRERAAWLADRVTLAQGWYATAGLRDTVYRIDFDRTGAGLRSVADAHARAWHVGTTVELQPRWLAYGSLSTGFEPNRGFDRAGAPLPPQRQRQTEVGLRVGAASAASTSVAAYRIDLSDVAMTDPLDRTALIAAGARRVDGIQASVNVRAAGFDFGAHANVLRMRRLVRTTASQGEDVPGVARQTAGLQASAPFAVGPFAARGYVQASWVGRRAADAENTTFLPGYGLAHVGAEITLAPTTKVALGVRNLFDKRYIEAVTALDDVYQGPRRAAWLRLDHRF